MVESVDVHESDADDDCDEVVCEESFRPELSEFTFCFFFDAFVSDEVDFCGEDDDGCDDDADDFFACEGEADGE